MSFDCGDRNGARLAVPLELPGGPNRARIKVNQATPQILKNLRESPDFNLNRDPEPNLTIDVEGCSIDEVSQALGLRLCTVKSHIHRRRTRLKQLFAERECET